MRNIVMAQHAQTNFIILASSRVNGSNFKSQVRKKTLLL